MFSLRSFSLLKSPSLSFFYYSNEWIACSWRSLYLTNCLSSSLIYSDYLSALLAFVCSEFIVLLLSLKHSLRSSASASIRLLSEAICSNLFLCYCSFISDLRLSPSISAPNRLISSMLSILALLSSSSSFSISLYLASVYLRFSAVWLNFSQSS
jgi:hypothetical protein